MEQNLSLCECVTETTKVQDSLPENINQLMTLNAELETAVNVLNGEIWSLKQQLKAVIIHPLKFSYSFELEISHFTVSDFK